MNGQGSNCVPKSPNYAFHNMKNRIKYKYNKYDLGD